MQTLFDNLASAVSARDAAIDRVRENAPADWKASAIHAVRVICETRPQFTTDDLWDLIDQPHEPRAAGAIMQDAARLGFCRPTGEYRQSHRRACHARPLRVWESLMCRTGAL